MTLIDLQVLLWVYAYSSAPPAGIFNAGVLGRSMVMLEQGRWIEQAEDADWLTTRKADKLIGDVRALLRRGAH